MQERVLGGLIIGGIAICGVVWAIVEGSVASSNAKKSEKELESTLYGIVEKYDSNVSSLDGKVISYYTEENTVKVPAYYDEDGNVIRWQTKKLVIPYITIYGQTEDKETFYITYRGSSDHVLDLDSKKIDSIKEEDRVAFITEGTGSKKMLNDIYANYTMTSPDFISSILSHQSSELVEYAVGDKNIYLKVFDDKGNSTEYINGVEQK